MPDAEVLNMLNRPDDWIPAALDLARSELTRRRVDFHAHPAALEASESADAERKAAEPPRPTNWQWLPLCLGILLLGGVPMNILKQHWIQDYGFVSAILMGFSTPETLFGLPVCALWYWLAGPNDPNDKSSH
jgi:hypothetical protein